ncbi:histidine phosphatase family protein [Candidatus Ruthia endofausta]|uniref:Histidine phosphatase family protein n=1 Tax=Candidatus Ruthia endofausta TaxID=2738852 RepID=A0A6N0HQ92_9GAMM|nr:histidine phosphatase family protein [Candidatus Ruthia endofausta]QKQ24421.1 histidine phosphatase family protein [Candidatus Ruthia endofausta]
MKLDLLRHGVPIGGRIYRGNRDDPLSKKGWQQMLDSIQGKSWDYIASSPLIRCAKFAKYLSKNQTTRCEIFNNFKELDFGDWQGKSVDSIGQTLIDNFKLDPVNHRPLNAENLYAFQARVLSSFKEIELHHTNELVLIVAHAGVIRVIKSYLLNLPIEKMFTIEVICASSEHFDF